MEREWERWKETADNRVLRKRTIKVPHSGRLLYGNWAIWGISLDVIRQMCNTKKTKHKITHTMRRICEKLIFYFRQSMNNLQQAKPLNVLMWFILLKPPLGRLLVLITNAIKIQRLTMQLSNAAISSRKSAHSTQTMFEFSSFQLGFIFCLDSLSTMCCPLTKSGSRITLNNKIYRAPLAGL